MLPRFLRRLRARWKYRHFERDLAQEIETHRAMAEAEIGRAAAARRLGNVTLAREDSRAMWIPTLLQQFSQDARYALRGLRRAPGFAISAISMLTIGLGLVAGGYTLVNGVFFRGWSVPASDDVFVVSFKVDLETRREDGLSLAAYQHLQTNARAADYVFKRIDYARIAADSTSRGEHTEGAVASANLIEVLGIPLQRGTGLSGARRDGMPPMVISHGVWQRVFGGDPSIVGRIAWLSGKAVTIVGVTSREFEGLGPHSLGFVVDLPSARQFGRHLFVNVTDTDCCVGQIAGRAREGRSRDDVRREMELLVGQFRQGARQTPLGLAVNGTTLGEGLSESPKSSAIQLVLTLIGAGVVLIMVLTFANVGNLFLARSLKRRREISVRLSLGASRARVVRQLVVEGLVLAAIAGSVAFAMTLSTAVVMRLIEDDFTASMLPSDWRVALFTAAGVVAASLIVSLTPALQTTRIVWRGANATMAGSTGRMRGLVLAAQISIAAVLVLSAVLITRGIVRNLNTRADFALHTTTVTEVRGAAGHSYTGDQLLAISTAFRQVLSTGDFRPGVIHGGRSTAGSRLSAGGVALKFREGSLDAELAPLSPTAASVLELRLAAGRWMAEDWSRHEAVVNETLARKLALAGGAIGRQFELGRDKRTYTIVGVARDTHLAALGDVEPTVHVMPVDLWPTFVTKTARDVDAKLRALVASVDPNLVVVSRPLSQDVRDMLEAATISASIASIFAIIALLLAIIGVFGVFTYLIEERRNEIGIRLALGASRRQIAGALYRACRGPVLGGLAAGLAMSAGAGVALRGFLLGLSPADPVSYLAVAVVLGVAALAATAIPVRRALRVDPAVTLKAD
jgi:predicted permease